MKETADELSQMPQRRMYRKLYWLWQLEVTNNLGKIRLEKKGEVWAVH